MHLSAATVQHRLSLSNVDLQRCRHNNQITALLHSKAGLVRLLSLVVDLTWDELFSFTRLSYHQPVFLRPKHLSLQSVRWGWLWQLTSFFVAQTKHSHPIQRRSPHRSNDCKAIDYCIYHVLNQRLSDTVDSQSKNFFSEYKSKEGRGVV